MASDKQDQYGKTTAVDYLDVKKLDPERRLKDGSREKTLTAPSSFCARRYHPDEVLSRKAQAEMPKKKTRRTYTLYIYLI